VLTTDALRYAWDRSFVGIVCLSAGALHPGQSMPHVDRASRAHGGTGEQDDGLQARTPAHLHACTPARLRTSPPSQHRSPRHPPCASEHTSSR
jgi:hypothetical protein